MKFSSRFLVVTAAIIATGSLLTAKTVNGNNDTIVPVVFEVNPPNPAPNTQVTITVVLEAPTPTGQIVTIGSTDPLAFTNLPTEIVVPAGDSEYTFFATTSSVYTRWAVLAATSNGGTALAVQPW